jgi:taurine dioxygenase
MYLWFTEQTNSLLEFTHGYIEVVPMPTDEHQTILAYLYQHAENPLFQCRFRWTENAIAFWDNRCAQHRAMWDYWPHTRSGTRVTIKGERPV